MSGRNETRLGRDAGSQRRWAIFRTNGIVTKRIYFCEFSDYWEIIGIIDQEVKRKLCNAVDAIRDAADKLEKEQ